MTNNEIVNGLFNFVIIAVIFFIITAIVLRILSNRFKIEDKKTKIYGLFLNLNKKSLVSISALIVNYLFLSWWTIKFCGLNIIYIAFSLVLLLISDIAQDNAKGAILSVILTVANCSLVQIIYLIHGFVTESKSLLLMIVLVLLVIFSILYYAYLLFKSSNNIIIKNKHIKHKQKYKV